MAVTSPADRLRPLRSALLTLHKALLDAERITYERMFGIIQSPNQFLQLLSTDPWFAWLHPLSQLIVAMDEALVDDEPLTSAGLNVLVKRARTLLVATEEGEGFGRQYFDALQRDTDVVLAHATVMKQLRAPKKQT